MVIVASQTPVSDSQLFHLENSRTGETLSMKRYNQRSELIITRSRRDVHQITKSHENEFDSNQFEAEERAIDNVIAILCLLSTEINSRSKL